jgi:hypothetical protein
VLADCKPGGLGCAAHWCVVCGVVLVGVLVDDGGISRYDAHLELARMTGARGSTISRPSLSLCAVEFAVVLVLVIEEAVWMCGTAELLVVGVGCGALRRFDGCWS